MKIKFFGKVVFLFSILLFNFAACNGSGETGTSNSNSENAQPNSTQREWTVLVYMASDNNLATAGLDDINEMQTVGSTDQVSIVVQSEFNPQYSNVETAETMRMLIKKDDELNDAKLNQATSIGNINMSDPASLTDFIKWGVGSFPAKNYALILWSHGGGIKSNPTINRGALQDETHAGATMMSLNQMSTAIKDSGVEFALIDFDACLMAMLEVAKQFQGLTPYLTASEETEPGDGNDYKAMLSQLVADPTMDGKKLAQILVQTYDDSYEGTREQTTKSGIDLTKIDPLIESTVSLTNLLLKESNHLTLLQAAQDESQQYAFKDYHDLYGFAEYVLEKTSQEEIKQVAQAVMDKVDAAVFINLFNGDNVSNSHGIAFYLPKTTEASLEDLELYSQLAINQTSVNRSSEDEEEGSLYNYVNSYIDQMGGVRKAAADGGLGVYIAWVKPDGSSCDADLDLYIVEPDGSFYAPHMGASTPNGYFSADSSQTGTSEEYYVTQERITVGSYNFLVNYYADGESCNEALVFMFLTDPANGVTEWVEIGSLSDSLTTYQLMSLDESSRIWEAMSVNITEEETETENVEALVSGKGLQKLNLWLDFGAKK